MLPRHSGWVAAFVLTLLLAAVGAASESVPLSAATIKARASVAAAAEAGGAVEADAGASVSLPFLDDAPAPSPTAPLPERRVPLLPSQPPEDNGTAPPKNGTTNESEEAPVVQPVPNETLADKPVVLSPDRQDLSGMAGAPIRFTLLVTNPAKVAQEVAFTIKSPKGWDVRVNPASAILGPDETLALQGSVLTPRLVGTSGTIAITATGSGGDDIAYVDVCSAGELGNACESQRARPPPANHTPPQNGTPPPSNETPPPPPPSQEPQDDTDEPTTPSPTPPPPTNSTPPPSNATGNSAGSGSGSSGSSAAYAQAWVTISASSGEDEEDEAATTEEEEADAGSSSAVQVEV